MLQGKEESSQAGNGSGVNLTQPLDCSSHCGPLMAHGGRVPHQRQPELCQHLRALILTGSRRASRCGSGQRCFACIALIAVCLQVLARLPRSLLALAIISKDPFFPAKRLLLC